VVKFACCSNYSNALSETRMLSTVLSGDASTPSELQTQLRQGWSNMSEHNDVCSPPLPCSPLLALVLQPTWHHWLTSTEQPWPNDLHSCAEVRERYIPRQLVTCARYVFTEPVVICSSSNMMRPPG